MIIKSIMISICTSCDKWIIPLTFKYIGYPSDKSISQSREDKTRICDKCYEREFKEKFNWKIRSRIDWKIKI